MNHFYLTLFLSFAASSQTSAQVSAHVSSETPLANYHWQQLSESGLVEVHVETKRLPDPKSSPDQSFKVISVTRKAAGQIAKTPQKIIVVGDTGCRMKETAIANSYQDCRDEKKWPFRIISERIAAEKPDLVIHTGDIHYREHCSEGKSCKKFTDVIGTGWLTWEADFLSPAQKAMEASPWMITRGNHEDCQRAFLGYREILTNQKWPNDKCVKYEAAQFLRAGDFLLIDFDSSSMEDTPYLSKSGRKLWFERFEELSKRLDVETKIKKPKAVLFVTHKPLYGFTKLGVSFVPGNVNLREVFESSSLKRKVDIILSGHIHSAQVVKSAGLPAQLVVGNSGTELDDLGDQTKLTELKNFGYDSVFVANKGVAGFGYAVLTQLANAADGPKSWQIEFKNVDGKSEAKCVILPSKEAQPTCTR